MMFFIELQYFDKETLNRLRRKMLAESTNGARWTEWTPTLSLICEQPDLTLIGPQHLSWGEVAMLANAANGRQVVLLGDCQFTLGLQVLPQDFAMRELLAIMPWSAQGKAGIPSNGAESDYKQTIPLRLP